MSGQPRSSLGVLLFATTLLLGSSLLFVVEPMVARMVLPVLGGAPMVWTGCVLFFQAMLLAGYAYAHAASRWMGPRWSAAPYVVLLLVPLGYLPLAIQAPPLAAGQTPLTWLFATLLAAVGAPFFVLAASTTVLQNALANSRHPAGRDRYFLYVASNTGSLLGLVSYPLIVERVIGLQEQRRVWNLGYAVFAILAALCLTAAWRFARRQSESLSIEPPDPRPISARRRLRWVALAAVPSSLTLGVTSYLSTDISAVPLLWVVPLSLYLLTFMAAFSRPEDRRAIADRRLAMGVVAVSLFVLLEVGGPIWLVLPVHLLTFALAALLCHSALALDRPPARHLTEFYLWIAVGGVAGGLFNTLVAPIVFTGITEYPMALVAACLVRDGRAIGEGWRGWLMDAIAPIAIGLVTLAAIVGLHARGLTPEWALGVIALACFGLMRQARRFALAVGALLLVGSFAPYGSRHGQLLLAERTFFGVYRIYLDPSGPYHALFHGTTLHGLEATASDRSLEPLTYYHRTGPFGDAFAHLPQASTTPEVAVVGLGLGSLAAYAGPAQRWTFYELDPEVERLARDTRYFHHLEACGARCVVVVGDARLSIARSPPGEYGLIVLDAFSSDAIPMHLVTSEAFALYESRLAPEGVLMLHVSNRHVALGPILGRLAAAHGLAVRERIDPSSVQIDKDGKTSSDWVVMARHAADLGGIMQDTRWHAPRVLNSTPLWTDDFSSLLSVFSFDR